MTRFSNPAADASAMRPLGVSDGDLRAGVFVNLPVPMVCAMAKSCTPPVREHSRMKSTRYDVPLSEIEDA